MSSFYTTQLNQADPEVFYSLSKVYKKKLAKRFLFLVNNKREWRQPTTN